MSHILPLTPTRPSTPKSASDRTPDRDEASTMGEVAFSTIATGVLRSSFESDPPETSSPSPAAKYLARVLAPIAAYAVPILRTITFKPSPLPPAGAETRPTFLNRIRSLAQSLFMTSSSRSSDLSSTAPQGNPSLWSNAHAQPPTIWISKTPFGPSPSTASVNHRSINTFKVFERIRDRDVLVCGAEVYGRTIGVGDRVNSPTARWQNPGEIRGVFKLTRTHVIFVWRVERFGGNDFEDELLAVPVEICRLPFITKVIYTLFGRLLPSPSLSYVIPATSTELRRTETLA